MLALGTAYLNMQPSSGSQARALPQRAGTPLLLRSRGRQAGLVHGQLAVSQCNLALSK